MALGVLGLTGTASAAPPSAAPLPLTCGTVLTASITLHSNLECSSTSVDSAFVIGAPNITVNLNGYTISAPPPTSPSCCIHGAGVLDGESANGSYPPYNGVTVKNGDITGFLDSTQADGVSGWRVTGITSAPTKIGRAHV